MHLFETKSTELMASESNPNDWCQKYHNEKNKGSLNNHGMDGSYPPCPSMPWQDVPKPWGGVIPEPAFPFPPLPFDHAVAGPFKTIQRDWAKEAQAVQKASEALELFKNMLKTETLATCLKAYGGWIKKGWFNDFKQHGFETMSAAVEGKEALAKLYFLKEDGWQMNDQEWSCLLLVVLAQNSTRHHHDVLKWLVRKVGVGLASELKDLYHDRDDPKDPYLEEAVSHHEKRKITEHVHSSSKGARTHRL